MRERNSPTRDRPDPVKIGSIRPSQTTPHVRARRDRRAAVPVGRCAWAGHCDGRSLVSQGWTIVSAADTATKEAGVDILAERDQSRLAVEVKGYPSDRYVSGKRRGEKKPTRPPVQARHWYAGALLTTMLTQGSQPSWTLTMALPDFPTYRSLFARTASSLRALDVDVYLVSEDGRVTTAELA